MSSGSSNAAIAAFDFDKTLTTADTLRRFLVEACGRPALYRTVARRCLRLAKGLRDDTLRDAAKAVLLRDLLAGMPIDHARKAATRVAEDTVAHRLRPDTVACARAHLAAGHRVIIVSASIDLYVTMVADRLGIAEVIATRLEVVDHRLSGELDGRNVRAEVKALLLKEHTGTNRVRWAYGDSAGDRQMLSMADSAVRVGRDPVSLPTWI
jgi:phosphatidylglycerophosphatase C